MTIEVEVEDTFNFTDEEEKMWFENEVLLPTIGCICSGG